MKKILSVILAALLLTGLTPALCEEPAPLTFTSPSGAPAIALAPLANENPDHFSFIAAETIAAALTQGVSDFVVAPVNAGAKLFAAGKSGYRLAAVLTWGNLVFASQRPDFQLSDMNGAAVTLFGENTVNAAIALYVLEQNGIKPASIEYLGSAAATQALLLSDAEAIVMTAEPAVTAAKIKNPAVTACPLNSLYEAVTGDAGFAQAGLFVRAETLAERPEDVAAALQEIEASAARCESDLPAVAAAAVALELLPNQKVAEAAIPGCSIRFVPAADAREAVERTAQVDLSQFGGKLPADDFYYIVETADEAADDAA